MQVEPFVAQSASREALNELIALRRTMERFDGCTSLPQTGQPYHVHWQVRNEHVFQVLRAELVQDFGYKEVEALPLDPCTLLPRSVQSQRRCFVYEKLVLKIRPVRITLELIDAEADFTHRERCEDVLSVLNGIIPLAVHGTGNVFETSNAVIFDQAEQYVVGCGFFLKSVSNVERTGTILTYTRTGAGGLDEVVQLWFYPNDPTISVRQAAYYRDPATGEYVRYGGHGAVVTNGDDFVKTKILRRMRKDNPSVSEQSCVWRIVLQ